MNSELVDQAKKVIPEVPLLINMVSRRVAQLNVGRPPLVSTVGLGNADIALTEIIEGKVALKDEAAEAMLAKKAAKKAAKKEAAKALLG